MDTDKRLIDENGRVLPYLKPIAEHRPYSDFNVANGVLGNIRSHYPDLQCEIVEDFETYYVRLVECSEPEYYI